MNFRSKEEIVAYMRKSLSVAIKKTKEKVYEIIQSFLQNYYKEYSPEIYERTFQLLKSLVKEDVGENGFIVYFDAGALDYSMKSLHFRPVGSDMSGYMNPFNHAVSPDGTFINPHGDGGKSLEAAMHGSHGGYIGGTAIWDESMDVIKPNIKFYLMEYLKQAGVPVR